MPFRDYDELLEMVLEQIDRDVSAGDFTAIAELLKSLTWEQLESYLPEEL